MQVTQDMGIEPPVPISSKLGDFNNLFRKILTAAQHPHLSIPETEAGKSRKHYNRLINRSLLSVSSTFSSSLWHKFSHKQTNSCLVKFSFTIGITVGAAAVVVGLAAYRVYAARKSASAWEDWEWRTQCLKKIANLLFWVCLTFPSFNNQRVLFFRGLMELGFEVIVDL